MTQQYFGKYRGTVVSNVDPMMMGRITAIVPDVSSVALTSWAMPCFPMAGIQTGSVAIPPPGAGVWIEFERGDPDYPIWTGGFFGSAAEVPALHLMTPPGLSALTMQTMAQNGVTVTDLPGPTGGIVIKTPGGASLIVNDTGIYIQNGRGASITLVGPTVTVNNGALTVI
ncbi:phage baseplate assembly protein V [Rhodovulum marinum]|uniref:Gp5/Type VI secretion system Vgr protein OB-fold domain-containing protein n=1 Tax=Rhodovulum marinum TaxID=320662 RepID=A0A4R2Q597_9RHOB|nr:phage baseplate assembly protein V [Rhodovulum marinum]TCP41861.1 hypothetical protein EV662_104205 [Rhodovulum marinum]